MFLNALFWFMLSCRLCRLNWLEGNFSFFFFFLLWGIMDRVLKIIYPKKYLVLYLVVILQAKEEWSMVKDYRLSKQGTRDISGNPVCSFRVNIWLPELAVPKMRYYLQWPYCTLGYKKIWERVYRSKCFNDGKSREKIHTHR